MNNKISCWIVDDEPLGVSLLESYVHDIPYLELTGKYNNPILAMQNLLTEKVDLIFLDIQMPHINGMELAYQMPAETKIVFVTAFREYALEGYRVNAFDYLLKPVSFDEFRATCEKARDWFNTVNKTVPMQKITPGMDAIFVKWEHRILPIYFKDILYIEGLKDYIKIYTCDSHRPFVTLESMKKMEKTLPAGAFIRVHRSFIVQKNKIESISRNRVTVANREIPIGRTYQHRVLEFIGIR